MENQYSLKLDIILALIIEEKVSAALLWRKYNDQTTT